MGSGILKAIGDARFQLCLLARCAQVSDRQPSVAFDATEHRGSIFDVRLCFEFEELSRLNTRSPTAAPL